jgi:hypothetical protein
MAVLAGMSVSEASMGERNAEAWSERDRDGRGSETLLERNGANRLHDAFLIPSQGVLSYH